MSIHSEVVLLCLLGGLPLLVISMIRLARFFATIGVPRFGCALFAMPVGALVGIIPPATGIVAGLITFLVADGLLEIYSESTAADGTTATNIDTLPFIIGLLAGGVVMVVVNSITGMVVRFFSRQYISRQPQRRAPAAYQTPPPRYTQQPIYQQPPPQAYPVAQTPAPQPPKFRGKVFISYRRQDTMDVAGRLYDHLKNRFSSDNIFFDVEAIPPGVDFRVHLSNYINQAKVVLVLIGPSWVSIANDMGQLRLFDPNDYVRFEVYSAMQRGVTVIPVLINNTAMPSPQNLPPDLQHLAVLNAVPLRPNPDFETDLGRLIRHLENLLV